MFPFETHGKTLRFFLWTYINNGVVLRFPLTPMVFSHQELQSHSEDHKGRHAEMAEHVTRLKQEKVVLGMMGSWRGHVIIVHRAYIIINHMWWMISWVLFSNFHNIFWGLKYMCNYQIYGDVIDKWCLTDDWLGSFHVFFTWWCINCWFCPGKSYGWNHGLLINQSNEVKMKIVLCQTVSWPIASGHIAKLASFTCVSGSWLWDSGQLMVELFLFLPKYSIPLRAHGITWYPRWLGLDLRMDKAQLLDGFANRKCQPGVTLQASCQLWGTWILLGIETWISPWNSDKPWNTMNIHRIRQLDWSLATISLRSDAFHENCDLFRNWQNPARTSGRILEVRRHWELGPDSVYDFFELDYFD